MFVSRMPIPSAHHLSVSGQETLESSSAELQTAAHATQLSSPGDSVTSSNWVRCRDPRFDAETKKGSMSA
ncbi:hypothetical protein RE6C_02913 [Rhodopirellula europaea 6C]|uniref:Uncharacterized protein n=1 Tax=Rhodopirellula europaea 6C TaxID=1263867 RepID=M2B478_9BACT|nr:hypothetical protein RE6C_02913 [Rhodopirellula europaea 6C]